MRVSEGTRLGHYEIQRAIGAGGMGEVYRARDTRLQRPAAIKIITAEDDDGDLIRRLEREALSASALNHPNILTVYELGVHEGLHYIATELVEGETLRERIRRGPIAVDPTLDVAIQIAAALDAAHSAGIVHRDIKPENVMVRPDGYVKVLDFGIAKLIESSAAAADSNTLTVQTVPGILIGTVGYMAPEQIRGLPVDHRADVWSFAVVLQEMLTGRSPFAGQTSSDVIAAVLERTPPTLASASVAAPAELQRIISKALSKDRDERYQTMKELLQDLQSLRESQKYEVRSQKVDVAKEQTPIPAPGMRRSLVLAAAAIAVVWMAWIGWSWTRTPVDHTVSPSPPSQPSTPSPATPSRTFEYWLSVHRLADGPQGRSADSAGDHVYDSASRFRFNFTNREPGFVYVLNEGRGAAGEPLLTMLYPTPSARGGSGSAELPAGEVVSTGYYRFDASSSVERLWIVWSVKPHRDLEKAKRWVNERDQGRIQDGADAAIVYGMLGNNVSGTSMRVNAEARRTIVTGRGDLLVHRAVLQLGKPGGALP